MKILIWGTSWGSKILISMIRQIYSHNSEIIGAYDPFEKSKKNILGEKIFFEKNGLQSLIKLSTHFAIGIGGSNGYARYVIAKKLIQKGLKPLSLISSYSIFDDIDSFGTGIQAMPGSVIHKFTKFGDQCIFNTNSAVDHDNQIGDGVHIMPGASIAGCCKIGNFSTIGTNSTIFPHIKIGENVIIGSGSVVTKDVSDNFIVYGSPAKFIRLNKGKNLDIGYLDKVT